MLGLDVRIMGYGKDYTLGLDVCVIRSGKMLWLG